MKKIKAYVIKLWKVVRLPEMLILPGNLAFFLILSLAPLITLFGLVASSLSLSFSGILSFFGDVLPTEVMEIVSPFIDGSGLNTGNFIFMFVGFYVASNGMDSLITASNVLYKTQSKNYISKRIKAIVLTILLLIMFIVVLIGMAFGTFILNKLSTIDLIGKFIINNYLFINAVKVVLVFAIIFVTIKIIYTIAPDMKLNSKFVNVGALFSTLAIMIVTSIFSFYVNNIAHYDIIYGSLASIAILMLLIYIISYIIVLGIAINLNYYKDEYNLDKSI